MEGVTACAGACCVGVVDGEALLFDGVFEVDGGAVEVGCAHLVDDDFYAVEVADCVAVEDALVEVELVDEAGAAAGLDGDAQAQVGAPSCSRRVRTLVCATSVRLTPWVGSSVVVSLIGVVLLFCCLPVCAACGCVWAF